MPSQSIELSETLLVIENGVALFSHIRPASRNAMTQSMSLDYARMLDLVEDDPSLHALIITGSGGSFCAGADLKAAHEVDSPESMRRFLRRMHMSLDRLRNLEMPVIAAVDGPAYGAGFAIALLCDFVLASSRASFCAPFSKIGLVADCGIAFTLPRIVGMPKAKELLYTARRVLVAEAEQLGIVHSIHTPESLAQEALAFARRFLKAPRESVALTKNLLNKSFETSYDTLAELEGQAQGVVSTTPYHLDAITRFQTGEPLLFDWDREAPV